MFFAAKSCIKPWEVANLRALLRNGDPTTKTLHKQHILAPKPLRRFLQILAPTLDSDTALPAYDLGAIAKRRAELQAAKSSANKPSSNPSGAVLNSPGS